MLAGFYGYYQNCGAKKIRILFNLRKNMSNRETFNKNTYADYKALASDGSLYKERVYLLKVWREINKLELKDIHDIKVLEIGCADGSFSAVLKQQGFDVWAVDISETAVAHARQNGQNAAVADIEKGTGFEANFFDLIIAAEVIEHLYDTDSALNEINRIMKPGAHLFITTPNLASLKNRLRLLFGRYPQYSEFRIGDKQAGHIRNYTPSALKQQLVDHGFSVEKLLSPNIIFPMTKNFSLFIKEIAIYLGDVFPSLGSHLVAR